MKKIIAFGASPSKHSINTRLATYVAHLFQNAEVEVLDINDYEMPIFTKEREIVIGIHPLAQKFWNKLGTADFLVISMAENNGAYTAAWKNLMDWASRIPDGKFFQGKPMLLLSTSDGKRGGLSVMEIAQSRFPRHDANILGAFSLPSFYENFDDEKGITDDGLREELDKIVAGIEF